MSEFNVGDRVLVPGVVTEVDTAGPVPYFVAFRDRNGVWLSATALRPDTGGRDLTAQDVNNALNAYDNDPYWQSIADYLNRIARGDRPSGAGDTAPPAGAVEQGGNKLDDAGQERSELPDARYREGWEDARAAAGPDEPLRAFAAWLVEMDNPEDAIGRERRRTVTLTQTIDRARAALAAARPAAEPVHDNRCEAEYVHEAHGWTECGCARRAAAGPAAEPACRYCGTDCSEGRSWDGDGYACPTCSDRRAAENRAAARTVTPWEAEQR